MFQSKHSKWLSLLFVSFCKEAFYAIDNNFHQRKEIHNIFLPYLFILFQSEKISIKHSMQLTITSIKEKKSINIFLPYLFILFQSEKISIKHSMQLTVTFIKEKKSIIYSYLISSFSFSLKRFALSILCNWQWLSSKKEIHNIFLPYLFILFQSEKISIKHSMQLTITFIKERNPKYIPNWSLYFVSVWKD